MRRRSGSGERGGSGDDRHSTAKVGIADRHSADAQPGLWFGRAPVPARTTRGHFRPTSTGAVAAGAVSRPAENGRIFESPVLTENPQPPPIPLAQPTQSDQTLPINLATALCLSNARPLVIAFAQASVEEAAARLQNAKVLWLPNLNVGTDYYRHDGTDQQTDGTMIVDDKSALAAGGGATLNFGVTDAIFRPLADRQELAARECDLQTARNDALLAVSLAYFDVQQARGTLAGTLDAVAKAEVLVQKTTGLAKGLIAENEVDRRGRCCSTCGNKWPLHGPTGASPVPASLACCA